MNRLDRNARLLATGFAAMAGMVDAIGFMASGGFFLSFMSGNSTRLSVGVVEGAPYVGLVAVLLASFVGGVVAGSLVGRQNKFGPHHRQAIILSAISLLLFAAPFVADAGLLPVALCFAAFCMGMENTLFEREGSVSFGLTYMTGALVKIGQGIATLISGGARLEWLPYLLLWMGLTSGAIIGALMFSHLGLKSLWLPAAYAGVFALALFVPRKSAL
jgi:uncharacterized membrane protein YoaK (UPF0700 family)